MTIPEQLNEYEKQLGNHSDLKAYELLSLCREFYGKYENQYEISHKLAEEIVYLKEEAKRLSNHSEYGLIGDILSLHIVCQYQIKHNGMVYSVDVQCPCADCQNNRISVPNLQKGDCCKEGDSCAVCRGECLLCNRGLKCDTHSEPYKHQNHSKDRAASHIVCKKFGWSNGLVRVEYENFRLRLDSIVGWTPHTFPEFGMGSQILTTNGIIYIDTDVSELDRIMEGR